jgi:hypothetical protein
MAMKNTIGGTFTKKRPLGLFILLLCLATSTCRVVDGPLGLKPQSEQSSLQEDIRGNIQPVMRSLANAVETVGQIYHASATISGHRQSSGTLFDGANLMSPSAEDDLVLTKSSTVPSTGTAASKSTPTQLTADSGATQAGSSGEIYDFTYSLVNATTIALPNPDMEISIEAKGSVDVVAGKASFRNVSVTGAIKSKSTGAVIRPFLIATMAVSNENSSQKFTVSYSEYVKFIKMTQSNDSQAQETQQGVIELTITKLAVALSVSELVLDPGSDLKIETLSGQWNFKDKSFTGEAKVSLTDNSHETLGVSFTMDSNAQISSRVWKRQPTPLAEAGN